MGDRANILVKSNNEQVCLYTHWDGYKIEEVLKAALIRGKERHSDFPYITRIIFSEMIKDSLMEVTGYGISQYPPDGFVLEVDVDEKTVNGVSFEDFCK